MSTALSRATRLALFIVLPVAAMIVPAALAASHAKVVARTAHNGKLGKTILVTTSGRTLYRLSAEHNGKFICVDKTCLSFWHPLVVARGTKPTGVNGLSVVRRPTGQMQVTFRGGPLYTFTGDKKAGDANGEGFKDVGVWHAASPQRATTPAPAPSPNPYPYP